jgi:beta-lactamase superfamily II metal-dependent hydrolase
MPFSLPYVAVIDVGHGNSTVLRDTSETIIVDCGARGSGLLEFLKKEGIQKINSVFLSHADQDHIGGLVTLLSCNEFVIESVYVNSDSSKGTAMWDDLAYELSQLNANGKMKYQVGITNGLGTLRWNSISLNVVGPTGYLTSKGVGSTDRQGRTITSNSISASFQIVWKERVIGFLAGDIDQVGLDDLVDHKIKFASPLLVFPHHGGNNEGYDNVSFAKQLCELTNPEIVIFSMGRNKHDNPRPEVVGAVRNVVKGVRVSCTQLSKNCAKILPSISSPHLLDLFSRGKEKNECCSGTFLIKLGDDIEYLPEINSHKEFIAKFTTTPLCT